MNNSLDMVTPQLYIATVQSRRMAGRNSPAVTIRFRTQKELALIRKAAKLEGLSLNTFVAGRAALAAERVIALELTIPTGSDGVSSGPASASDAV